MPSATEGDLDLATVGALLVNELVADSRGLVERPMQIRFVGALTAGPQQRLEELAADGEKVRSDGSK